jgi:signal peptidase I
VLGELIQTLLIAGVLFFGVNLTTARIRVDGSSMEPGLHNNDLVVVNRLAYQADLPTRGDIIVFRYPYSPDRRFIKRLIGLPGDHVFVRDGTLYVNGMALEEPYISAPPEYDGSWVVGPGEVFVLGDNRNNSSDSQNWGMLPLEEIIGKAILVYWPPSDLGVIPHYNLAVAAAD